MKRCFVKECSKKYYAKGYCQMHYVRNKKYGSPYGGIKNHSNPRKYITPEKEKQAIVLYLSSKLSCTEIGKSLEVSRGPIEKIVRKNNLKRDSIRKREVYKICHTCRNTFVVKPAATKRGRTKFCSKECYSRWQKSSENSGKNHWRWQGGYDSELQKLRKKDEWRQWRDKVYQRDNYTCQICGVVGTRLHPHHIFKKSKYPEFIFEVKNGVTLCKDCHMNKGVHKAKHLYLEKFLSISGFHEATIMNLY